MGRIVETRSGRVEGTEQGGALAFRGIPFARPPLGALRLRPPAPEEPWPGVRAGLRARRGGPPERERHGRPARIAAGPARRGLPHPRRDDSGLRRRTPARDGLDPRRRLRLRRRIPGRLRQPGLYAARRRGAGEPQLPPRCPRLAGTACARRGGGRRRRQPRTPRPDRRPRVGARLHRPLRRRPRQRHDLRRVGRRHERRHAARQRRGQRASSTAPSCRAARLTTSRRSRPGHVSPRRS